MKVSAVLASAGSGRRMHSKVDKPFIKIGAKELACYSLEALEDSPLISEITIASSRNNIERFKRLTRIKNFSKVKAVVKGGPTRFESVLNGLLATSPKADIVLIHDAARPFITRRLISGTVNAAKRYGVSVAAVKIKPTVKESDEKGAFVLKTLKRSALWEAQTPQAFKRKILLKAYEKAGRPNRIFTDDASLAEVIGQKVKIVNGNYSNIKITTPEDLVIAEAIAKNKK